MGKRLDRARLFSHPRSGTNFARATIAKCFFPKKNLERREMIATGHWSQRRKIPAEPAFKLRGGHQFWNGHTDCIYLLRDGRDVALSMYRTSQFRHADDKDITFSEFIRCPLDWYSTPGIVDRTNHNLTIVSHWLQHVDSWQGRRGVCHIRYEDLLLNPDGALSILANHLDLDPARRTVVKRMVGPYPGKGGAYKWKEKFSDEDLEYFFSIVPEHHWALYE